MHAYVHVVEASFHWCTLFVQRQIFCGPSAEGGIFRRAVYLGRVAILRGVSCCGRGKVRRDELQTGTGDARGRRPIFDESSSVWSWENNLRLHWQCFMALACPCTLFYASFVQFYLTFSRMESFLYPLFVCFLFWSTPPFQRISDMDFFGRRSGSSSDCTVVVVVAMFSAMFWNFAMQYIFVAGAVLGEVEVSFWWQASTHFVVQSSTLLFKAEICSTKYHSVVRRSTLQYKVPSGTNQTCVVLE